MKKFIAITMVTLLFVTGCGKVAKMENGEDAVVTLKDGKISINSLYDEMKNDYALSVLINMVDNEILSKLYPTDEIEDNYVSGQLEQAKQYHESYYSTQYPEFTAFLQAYYGVSTEEAFNETMRLTYKRNLAIKAYSEKQVTDEEIQKYYDEKSIGDIRASHILIKVETSSTDTDEQKTAKDKAALEKANSIIAELNAGADFATLAKKYSDDGSSDKGGDLSWFNRGDMVDAFEEAAIKLKKGEYTKEPVKTEYGYHIILKTDEKAKPELKTVKQTIIETLGEEKLAADENMKTKALIALREDNDIKIQDDELRRQYESYTSKY